MDQVDYKPGELIFKEGARPQGFICLKQGKVKITRLAANGKTQIIDLKSAPDTIGIRALATKTRYRSSAIALSPVSVCMIPKDDFFEVFDNAPQVARAVIHYLAERLKRADDKQLCIAQKHLRARMADTLLELSDHMGRDDSGWIDIDLKRSELAQLSAMTTSNATRTLSELRDQGIVALSGRRIRILKSELLLSISEHDYQPGLSPKV